MLNSSDVNSELFFWVENRLDKSCILLSAIPISKREKMIFSLGHSSWGREPHKPEVIEFKAGHGPITETPFPRLEFSPGVLVEDLACQRSFPRPFILSTASVARFHTSVIINFIDRLGFGISQCRTLLNQLSKGLEAMDAKIATYLEWICSGYFKPLVNSNPRKKLFKVSLFNI